MQAIAKPAIGTEHRHWDNYQKLVEAAKRQAVKGKLSGVTMLPLEEDLAGIPGGRWFYRDGREITAGLKKAFVAYTAKLAREAYMQARLEKKRVLLGLSLDDLGVTVGAALASAGVRWDDRIWRARGGRGRVDDRSVYRLKLWWNHNGSGEVITRSIRAQVDKVAARLARFRVQDLKYRRLDDHLTVLRTKLAALARCPLCAASLYTQWHILAECPHPDLRSARLEVAVELRELAASLFDNKVNPFKHPLNDWQLMFATESGCWVWPEVERRREVDHQAGWNTCQWYGLWDRRYLDGWVQQLGDVVAARHWFRITAIMQKIGWGAIEGCKKIWGIARRL
jgi:hypothetical protein